MIRPKCKGIEWGRMENMKDIEFADDITLFADTKKEIEELGDIAIEATTDCGTGINDKTEVRVYGTTPNEDRTDQIRIGPYTCKNLREPCPFLGIIFSNNMTGSCHHKIRQKKGGESVRQIEYCMGT